MTPKGELLEANHIAVCYQCKEHTSFEREDDKLISICCGASPHYPWEPKQEYNDE